MEKSEVEIYIVCIGIEDEVRKSTFSQRKHTKNRKAQFGDHAWTKMKWKSVAHVLESTGSASLENSRRVSCVLAPLPRIFNSANAKMYRRRSIFFCSARPSSSSRGKERSVCGVSSFLDPSLFSIIDRHLAAINATNTTAQQRGAHLLCQRRRAIYRRISLVIGLCEMPNFDFLRPFTPSAALWIIYPPPPTFFNVSLQRWDGEKLALVNSFNAIFAVKTFCGSHLEHSMGSNLQMPRADGNAHTHDLDLSNQHMINYKRLASNFW